MPMDYPVGLSIMRDKTSLPSFDKVWHFFVDNDCFLWKFLIILSSQ